MGIGINNLPILFVVFFLVFAISACGPSSSSNPNPDAYLKEGGVVIPTNAQIVARVHDYTPTGRSFAMHAIIPDETFAGFVASNNLFEVQNSDYDVASFPFFIPKTVTNVGTTHWIISSRKTVSGYVIASTNRQGLTDVYLRFYLPE